MATRGRPEHGRSSFLSRQTSVLLCYCPALLQFPIVLLISARPCVLLKKLYKDFEYGSRFKAQKLAISKLLST